MLQTTTYTDAAIRVLPVGEPGALAGAARPQCATCKSRELCLPGLSPQDLERVDGLMFARRRVKLGDSVVREGEKFQFIYAVRSGAFKTIATLKDGREHVTGFPLAGDLMGLDGLAEGRHASEAVALEDGEICAIPYRQLADLAADSTQLQQSLTRIMSSAIVREHSAMLLLGSMNAEERVASFLLNISQRMRARGYSPREFHLRMSRAEIGSYLGMKLETVSRTLSAFQHQGLLQVEKKFIRIVDLEVLAQAFEVRVH